MALKLTNFFVISIAILLCISIIGCSVPEPEQPLPADSPQPPDKITYTPSKPLDPEKPLPSLPSVKSIVEKPDKLSKLSSPNTNQKREIIITPNREILTATFPVSVLDRDSKEIVFEKAPERIVAFDSAALEILFAIGEGSRVVATHDYVTYPREAAGIPRVGDAFNMDVETIVGLEPDLVYLFYPSFKNQLEEAGLNVLLIPTIDDDFRQMAQHFRMWGSITGAVNEAEDLARDFESRIQKIEYHLEPYNEGPSVFQDVGGLWAPGDNTLVGNVFQLLKLDNISGDVEGYAQVSPEILVERNPQYIIASYGDSFTNDIAFKDILAVKNNSIYTPSEDLLSISGPRFIEGVEELAEFIYPGILR